MITKKLLSAAVAASLSLPAIPVLSGPLEEVVVTARKREESILKVPVAATALTGNQLEKLQTNNLTSLTERAPGLVLGENVAAVGTQISLRGIGTAVLNPTIDQSVSLNVDGLGMTQGLAYKASFFDLQQIEVLRGPQSLFYGKNSTAGVISITTANPGDEFEVMTRLAYEFEGEEKLGEFVVSGPVTDTLGLRLATRLSELGGYFHNEAEGDGITGLTPKYGSDFPQKNDFVLRGTAVWTPTEALKSVLKVTYARDNWLNDGGGAQYGNCPDGNMSQGANDLFDAALGPIGPLFYNSVSPNDDCKIDDTLYLVDMNPDSPFYAGIRGGGTPFLDMEQTFGTLQVDYDLTDELVLSSITGFYDMNNSNMINGGLAGQNGPTIVADSDFSREEFTQEVRLTSNFTSSLNFMAGFYYQDGSMTNRTGLFFLGPRDKGKLNIDVETKSLFGQLLWQVTERVEIAAGARWTDEERSLYGYNLETGFAFDGVGDPNDPGDDARHPNIPVTELGNENVSPEISITYTPTDDLTFFASYRKAFKSGSWDTVSNPRGADISFDDEEVDGFEMGIKSRLYDNTLAINVSAYKYEYTDLQTGTTSSTPSGFVIRTENAASADVEGIDFDINYAPPSIEGLTLFAAVNYNHARYGSFNNATCWGGQSFAEGCNQQFDPDAFDAATGMNSGVYGAQDLSGKELFRAPEYQASFGFDYERPFANGDLIWGVSSSTQWSDEFYTNPLLREDTIQDSYFKVGLSFFLKDADESWEAALIGKNINNEITTGQCSLSNIQTGNLGGLATGSPTNQRGLGGIEEMVCQPDRPREIWLRFTVWPTRFFN